MLFTDLCFFRSFIVVFNIVQQIKKQGLGHWIRIFITKEIIKIDMQRLAASLLLSDWLRSTFV